jgi:hypothetical protein
MHKMTMVVLLGFVLVGCAGAEKPKGDMRGTHPVLTTDLATTLVERGTEEEFSAVLGKIAAGPHAGSYALFPGKGGKTAGFLLEKFDGTEYEKLSVKLKQGECVWVILKAKCRAFSAPYPTNPRVDPWGVFYDYTVLSTTVGNTPVWVEAPIADP